MRSVEPVLLRLDEMHGLIAVDLREGRSALCGPAAGFLVADDTNVIPAEPGFPRDRMRQATKHAPAIAAATLQFRSGKR